MTKEGKEALLFETAHELQKPLQITTMTEFEKRKRGPGIESKKRKEGKRPAKRTKADGKQRKSIYPWERKEKGTDKEKKTERQDSPPAEKAVIAKAMKKSEKSQDKDQWKTTKNR